MAPKIFGLKDLEKIAKILSITFFVCCIPMAIVLWGYVFRYYGMDIFGAIDPMVKLVQNLPFYNDPENITLFLGGIAAMFFWPICITKKVLEFTGW